MTELRIRKANVLLVESDHIIQHIAEQVGIVNVNSFIRMFKKVTGMTPGEYKRHHQMGR
ncbi:helix-turn-helix domain-containing protein [Paenibacillus sp. MBLB4367]|uniref:helix-turn-helix domain-containing protein n=1 Tax=Paenibacillus sp. MBLB4367 TaxID=3384767 RepID=UPI0039080B5D